MSFPPNFIWATATAAYQIEGGGTDHGRGLSTWDAVRAEGDRIADNSSSSQNCGGFEHAIEDVQLIKALGVSHYRFSLSWSRILPEGTIDHINEEGIQHYIRVLEELIRNGIQPIVTLFHCDWPLVLFRDGGWLHPRSQQRFEDFARLCFERFGKLVPTWITFNEIPMHAFSDVIQHEGEPWYAPRGPVPAAGVSTPYAVAHQMILAHARVYRMYKTDFADHNGKIGVVAGGHWCVGPDEATTARAFDSHFNWLVAPIFGADGDYPKSLRESLTVKNGGAVIPEFSKDEKAMVKGSADFLGVNYYRPHYVTPGENGTSLRQRQGHFEDSDGQWEKISGPQSWVRNAPECLVDLLQYIRIHYNNIPVMITENGCPDLMGEDSIGTDPLNDQHRIRYIEGHIDAAAKAISLGCNVIGYTVWSLMDNFEWGDGFAVRFGLYRVDLDSPLKKRTPKESVNYVRQLMDRNKTPKVLTTI